jgi:hypothetical protein
LISATRLVPRRLTVTTAGTYPPDESYAMMIEQHREDEVRPTLL